MDGPRKEHHRLEDFETAWCRRRVDGNECQLVHTRRRGIPPRVSTVAAMTATGAVGIGRLEQAACRLRFRDWTKTGEEEKRNAPSVLCKAVTFRA